MLNPIIITYTTPISLSMPYASFPLHLLSNYLSKNGLIRTYRCTAIQADSAFRHKEAVDTEDILRISSGATSAHATPSQTPGGSPNETPSGSPRHGQQSLGQNPFRDHGGENLVLYCTIFFYHVYMYEYYGVVYCAALIRTVLYCTVLYCTVLYVFLDNVITYSIKI